MSLTSLDQSKLGSRNALNRRVIIIYLVVCTVIGLTAPQEQPLTPVLYRNGS